MTVGSKPGPMFDVSTMTASVLARTEMSIRLPAEARTALLNSSLATSSASSRIHSGTCSSVDHLRIAERTRWAWLFSGGTVKRRSVINAPFA